MAKSFSSIMKKLGTTNILIVAVAIVVILCCYLFIKKNPDKFMSGMNNNLPDITQNKYMIKEKTNQPQEVVSINKIRHNNQDIYVYIIYDDQWITMLGYDDKNRAVAVKRKERVTLTGENRYLSQWYFYDYKGRVLNQMPVDILLDFTYNTDTNPHTYTFKSKDITNDLVQEFWDNSDNLSLFDYELLTIPIRKAYIYIGPSDGSKKCVTLKNDIKLDTFVGRDGTKFLDKNILKIKFIKYDDVNNIKINDGSGNPRVLKNGEVFYGSSLVNKNVIEQLPMENYKYMDKTPNPFLEKKLIRSSPLSQQMEYYYLNTSTFSIDIQGSYTSTFTNFKENDITLEEERKLNIENENGSWDKHIVIEINLDTLEPIITYTPNKDSDSYLYVGNYSGDTQKTILLSSDLTKYLQRFTDDNGVLKNYELASGSMFKDYSSFKEGKVYYSIHFSGDDVTLPFNFSNSIVDEFQVKVDGNELQVKRLDCSNDTSWGAILFLKLNDYYSCPEGIDDVKPDTDNYIYKFGGNYNSISDITGFELIKHEGKCIYVFYYLDTVYEFLKMVGMDYFKDENIHYNDTYKAEENSPYVEGRAITFEEYNKIPQSVSSKFFQDCWDKATNLGIEEGNYKIIKTLKTCNDYNSDLTNCPVDRCKILNQKCYSNEDLNNLPCGDFTNSNYECPANRCMSIGGECKTIDDMSCSEFPNQDTCPTDRCSVINGYCYDNSEVNDLPCYSYDEANCKADRCAFINGACLDQEEVVCGTVDYDNCDKVSKCSYINGYCYSNEEAQNLQCNQYGGDKDTCPPDKCKFVSNYCYENNTDFNSWDCWEFGQDADNCPRDRCNIGQGGYCESRKFQMTNQSGFSMTEQSGLSMTEQSGLSMTRPSTVSVPSQPSTPSKANQTDDSQAILDFLMDIDPEGFRNYNKRVEHFNDLVRPENYNLVKLKSSKENELSFIEEKVDSSKTIYDNSEGEEFPTRLGHVLNHISTKFIRSAIRSALEGFINNEYIEIQKVKCVNTSLSNDCGVFTSRDVPGSIKLDNNPIDGSKSIKSKLQSFFRQALHAKLVKDKILASPEKLNILNTTKEFINGILSELNNKYSDSFTIYFEVDFEPADAANDYNFVLKRNNNTLTGNIAGIDDVTTQSSKAVVADADCVVNWGQWSDCQIDALSTCVPTPNVPGQFGARPGIQQRQSQIISPSRGKGKPCPLPQSEVRNCSVACEDPLEDSPLIEMSFTEFKEMLRRDKKTMRCDVFRSKDHARYLSNSLGRMTVSVDADNNFVRSYIPNKITQDCNNLNISTLYLRTFADDGNYTDKLVIVNPKMEYCTGKPFERSNLEGSLCSDRCNFIKNNSENTGQCLNRCVLESNCSPSCCASACMKQGAIIENFESGSICSFQPYGRSLDECKENCKNDGCNNVAECNRLCGECRSISCRWTLPDFTGVSEKPSSPNIIATPGNNSATIIWNRADDRGSRIERYIVVAYETTNPENGVRIELATNPSCTNCIHRVENLKNNLSYTVGVSAVNSGGVSKMSNTVVVIPSATSVDMSFVQSIQKDAVANVKSKDMLKHTIDKIILQRGNVDEQLLGELLAYRNQPEDKTLKDLLTKLAGSTIEITI